MFESDADAPTSRPPSTGAVIILYWMLLATKRASLVQDMRVRYSDARSIEQNQNRFDGEQP